MKQEVFEDYLGFKANPNANAEQQPVLIQLTYKLHASSIEQTIVLHVQVAQIKNQRNEISLIKEICDVHGLNEQC